MGSCIRDASNMRNKAQESILEPNMSLAHAFMSFHLVLYVKFNFSIPHKRPFKRHIIVVYVSKWCL